MNKKADVVPWACGLVIKSLRHSHGMKQYELAHKAGISAYRLSRLENAFTMPDEQDMKQISAVFDLKPAAMMDLILHNVRVLHGEVPADFSSQCIDYVALRDEQNHES